MPESTSPDDATERFLEDLFVREEIVAVEGRVDGGVDGGVEGGGDPLPPGVTHEIDADGEVRRRRYSID